MGADRGRVARPYGELIELAEREQELLANRDYEGLSEILRTKDALIAELPQTPPETARQAVVRLIELEEQIQAAVEDASRGIAVELSRLRNGRAGVRRYAPIVSASSRHDYSA